MNRKILILNGPNLNLLGKREPEKYGSKTLDDVVAECEALSKELGIECLHFQSNSEGELVSKIQEAGANGVGIVFNPGAYTHTSIALRDAISGSNAKVMEVHISNIHSREEFRHHSYVSAVAIGVIAGCGTDGYLLGVRALVNELK